MNPIRFSPLLLVMGAALSCLACSSGSGSDQREGQPDASVHADALGPGGEAGRGGSAGMQGTAGIGGTHRDGATPDAATAADSGTTTSPCDSPGLTWRTGSKTNYTSYPDPGSEECIKYSGCEYEGLFSACPRKETLDWVKAHNIVSVFPDFKQLKLHDLCLKSGSKTIVVTVLDECADSDCSGCCTENRGSADQLIDVESFTDVRWGVEDGPIQWADVGPTQGSGCQ